MAIEPHFFSYPRDYGHSKPELHPPGCCVAIRSLLPSPKIKAVAIKSAFVQMLCLEIGHP